MMVFRAISDFFMNKLPDYLNVFASITLQGDAGRRKIIETGSSISNTPRPRQTHKGHHQEYHSCVKTG
ncbi:hypothetical protein CIT292_08977 [Citrobacter youngae ATCC 29220]|uniref:Uncharacterized protein n=1 Tax=Citrobacter youngae ATCC 29220 TaxID=500640 RepID=D4BFG1_9ENTR|nr:hypothetical protein CIT292_08977 [Citrobacter youngae ATCC 29220]